MFVPLVIAVICSAEPTRIPTKLITIGQPSGTLAEVLTEFTRQSGIPVATTFDGKLIPCPVALEKFGVWDALQAIADKADSRIELRERGNSLALVKRQGINPTAIVDGPFRLAVRQVRSVLDLDTGARTTDLTVDLHWEPRITVHRVDAEPTVTEAIDDRGKRITAPTARGKTAPQGAVYSTTIRLSGVPREARKLSKVDAKFTVTVADRMLDFRFPLAGKPPLSLTQDGVTAVVTRAGRIDERYEVELLLTYPPEHPEFESFESFVTDNRAMLVAGGKSWLATDPEVTSSGRRVKAVYRFPAAVPGGATLAYATPSPLAEYPIRFELHDIPLP